MSNKLCRNCGAQLGGHFCKNCGQRTTVNKVTFKETFQDFVDMVFSVNAPLMLTLKLLVINPGKLFREYLEGKRKKYYKPVAFLILATIVFALFRSLFNYDPMKGMVVAGGNNMDVSLIMEANSYMAKNANNIIFIFVFTLSLSFKLFFRRRYLWSEYVAISFYIIGFYTLLTSIVILYLKYFNPQQPMIPLVILFFYVLYAMTSFFKTNLILTAIKVAFAFMVSLLFYMILGFGLSFLIVWIKAN